ncbi:MAG: hypothetical protein WAM66_03785 [Acidobacteriaceae bacterium]
MGIRDVSLKLLALLCAALLVALPGNETWAQTNQIGQAPTTGWQTTKLSQAIVNDANRAVETLIVDNQKGRVTAADVVSAATALKMLSDHFQEIGLNAALQKEILDNQDALMDYQLNDSQMRTFQSRLALDGVNVDAARIQSVMNPTLNERQEFLSMVRTTGLYQTELEIVSELRGEAQQLSASEASGAQSARLTHSAHLVMVMTAVCKICYIAAFIGLATGCTATVEFCAAGVATCGTCAAGG